MDIFVFSGYVLRVVGLHGHLQPQFGHVSVPRHGVLDEFQHLPAQGVVNPVVLKKVGGFGNDDCQRFFCHEIGNV